MTIQPVAQDSEETSLHHSPSKRSQQSTRSHRFTSAPRKREARPLLRGESLSPYHSQPFQSAVRVAVHVETDAAPTQFKVRNEKREPRMIEPLFFIEYAFGQRAVRVERNPMSCCAGNSARP